MQETLGIMQKAGQKYAKLNTLYEWEREFWGELDKKWVLETEQNFVERMGRHFEVAERRVAEDNVMKELWPMFACKKRIKRK
jgi:hypothetical protein